MGHPCLQEAMPYVLYESQSHSSAKLLLTHPLHGSLAHSLEGVDCLEVGLTHLLGEGGQRLQGQQHNIDSSVCLEANSLQRRPCTESCDVPEGNHCLRSCCGAARVHALARLMRRWLAFLVLVLKHQ